MLISRWPNDVPPDEAAVTAVEAAEAPDEAAAVAMAVADVSEPEPATEAPSVVVAVAADEPPAVVVAVAATRSVRPFEIDE